MQLKDYLTQRQHPLDARAKKYELNKRGKYLMRAVIPDALRYEEELLSQLSATEREQLHHLIGKFNRILG